jgi:hypothetical protein
MRNLVVALALLSAASITRAEPFFIRLSLQGVTFQVESPNEGSINPVTVRVETSNGKPGPVQVEADGAVTNAEVGDLNGDGYPEIYIYVNSAGSGSYGSLIAYAASSKGPLSAIALPPLADDPGAARGYRGHDRFAVGEGSLLRRFPVYRQGDTNVAPSGGTRQVRYRLEAVEAGWRLVPCEVTAIQDAGNIQ